MICTDNIILKPDGNIKLIDFGIARTYKPKNLADTIQLGTVGYAAPEQLGGAQTDARTDIFGLGKTMQHLLTGISPNNLYNSNISIDKINLKLPEGLEHIISKCTQPNPNERYQSCEEVLADLNNYLSPQKSKGIFDKLFRNKKTL